VDELDPGKAREPFRNNVLLGTCPGGCVGNTGFRFRERDQLGERLHAERGMRGKHHRLAQMLCHRNEVLHRVKAELGIEVRRRRERIAEGNHGIAVGRAPGRDLRTDDARRAGTVFDQHLLAEGAR